MPDAARLPAPDAPLPPSRPPSPSSAAPQPGADPKAAARPNAAHRRPAPGAGTGARDGSPAEVDHGREHGTARLAQNGPPAPRGAQADAHAALRPVPPGPSAPAPDHPGAARAGPEAHRRPGPRAAPPDPLGADAHAVSHALAVLRAAEQAFRDRQRRAAPAPAPREEESFSPVGRPRWRAGPRGHDGPAPGTAPHGTAHPATGPATDRAALARRITAIHLTDFAMARWLRWAASRGDAPPDDLPTALAVEGAHGPVIHAVTRAAALAGVHPGARVVDMRALVPSLRVEFADRAGDAAALARLMLWCRRWCPWTAVDGDDGLVMDTTGSDHLWGGEAAMLRTIEAGLATLGLSARLAVAPTHGAAWALARFGPVRAVCPPEALAAATAPLPVRALRLDDETVLLLGRLGLKTVGDIAAVPRISLARRFSRAPLPANPLLRHDQMTGRLAEPVGAPDDPPRFAVQTQLAEPVQDPTPHLPALCATLCAGLAAAGFGARRVTVTVFRTDGEVRAVTVATARPTRDAAHLLRLFDGKLDAIDPGFGFDLVTLGATVAEVLPTAQTRLAGGAEDGAALARLIDRLSARLGPRAIRSPAPAGSHLPERAERWQAALTAPGPRPPAPEDRARPLRLLPRPEEIRVLYAVPEGPPAQFAWRSRTHRVVRFAGPERIAPEWWQDSPGTRLRDYYRIEDHRACRLWLYRDGVLGDGRGTLPRWFVQGIFA